MSDDSDDENEQRHEELDAHDEALYLRILSSEEIFYLDDFAGTGKLRDKLANKSYFTLIIYDIVSDHRRVKLAKLLLGYGERVQYSGFEAHLTRKKFEALTARIAELIESEDRVRLYRFPVPPEMRVFGKIGFTTDEDYIIL